MKRISPDFFTLTGEDDFRCRSRRLRYDREQQALILQRNDMLRLPTTGKAEAGSLLEHERPALCDANRELAWISADGKALLTGRRIDDTAGEPVRASAVEESAESAGMLELQPVTAPNDAVFTTLAMQERLVALGWSDEAAGSHGLDVVELGSKMRYRLDTLESAPRHLWIDPRARTWIVDSDNRLLQASGKPLPQAWNPQETAFQPLRANLHPFAVTAGYDLPAGGQVLSACGDEQYLYLLREGEILRYRLDMPQSGHESFALEPGLPYVTDCRVMPCGRIALWVPVEPGQVRAAQDCPLVELDAEEGEALLVRERYPRRRPLVNAFLANPERAAWYLSTERVLELTGLPQVRYVKRAASILLKRLDSRMTDTLWDRISLDAVIPGGTRIELQLRAFDHPDQRQQRAWHNQGSAVRSTLASRAATPHSHVWDLVIRKETNSGSVREIRGRYLEIKLLLISNGLCTPQLHSMQVWYPRLSWQHQYLPEFMHQVEDPAEDSTDLANGADARERMLTALASITHTVEQRIDSAETLIDPLTAPGALLPRLEAMLGEHPPMHWPLQRRRNWLSQSGELQRWRGTYKGLCLALDIATDGGVSRGQVVPVEDFRLRRPLFCALGIDFAKGHHPLTLDTVQSGNSIVGDTLTLGPDDARTLLLALLPETDRRSSVTELLQAYADTHAYRLSIVMHASAFSYRGVIEELLDAELPAHLDVGIIETERSFVPGLAPLLGIHTFLEEFPAWRRMVLDQDRIGGASVLMNAPLLRPGRSSELRIDGDNP
jgi:phage tail-like protein